MQTQSTATYRVTFPFTANIVDLDPEALRLTARVAGQPVTVRAQPWRERELADQIRAAGGDLTLDLPGRIETPRCGPATLRL